jgi:intracellular septation protein A
MPHTERLGTTISLVMLGLVLSAVSVLPGRQLLFTVFGSQLSVPLSGLTQLAIVMVGLACSGTDAVIQAHPLNRRRSLPYAAAFWALPGVLSVASLLLVRQLPWWGYRLALVLFSGALLAVVIVAQYHTVSSDDPRLREARLALNVLTYALAVFFFVVVYGSRLRSVVSATSIMVVSAMLSLELLRSPREEIGRTWIYAGVIGLLMGEATWVLNYSALDARAGGGLLLVIFYVMTGLAQQHLWRRLTRRLVIEYVALGLAALGFILLTFGWP